MALYRHLMEVAPQDKRCAVWAFRQARCLEQLQKRVEATAAYQQVLVQYPQSPVAMMAQSRLEAGKGGQK